MNYKQTLERLGNWIDKLQNFILLLAGIETVIVIIIGVASSNVYHDKYSKFWVPILWILGIIYVVITIFKIAYNKSFPSSIIEELSAKKDLEYANESIKRKDAINSYISNTIIDLNKCKCSIPLQVEGVDWHISSDNDFINEIKNLTSTFNSVVNTLLNTTNIKFTTGIYVDYFRGFNHENLPQSNNGTFLIRDDFDFQKTGQIRDIMSNNNISDIGLEIQNAIKSSYNNCIYLVKKIRQEQQQKAIIICSNIPNLKDTNTQKGVLFIITKPVESIPEDLESVLGMFSNIISHWLDLYQHEVVRRQIEIIGANTEDNVNPD